MKACVSVMVLALLARGARAEDAPPPKPAPAVVAADPAKDPKDPAPPKVQPAQPPRPPRWQSQDWRAVVERLRTHPRAGEINNTTVSAGIPEVFEMDAAATEKVTKLMDEYDAAVIQLAQKWVQETDALRGQYEEKILAEVPAARRETAKKVLDFSHKNWGSNFDRESKFLKEFTDRRTAMDKDREKLGRPMTADELKEGKQTMQTWVKERRAGMIEEDHQILVQLKAMLSPEESERLQKFDRSRPMVAQPAPGPAPAKTDAPPPAPQPAPAPAPDQK